MRNSRLGNGYGSSRTNWPSVNALTAGFLFVMVAGVFLCSQAANADIQTAKDEPNLEKRSDRALDNMRQALEAAREAAKNNDEQTLKTAMQEVVDSAELSYQSLEESGKAARANPKHFKRAELATSEILRRMDGLENQISFELRSMVESARKRITEINDKLVFEIMTKSKKK